MAEPEIFDFKSSALTAVNFILVFTNAEKEAVNLKCKFSPEMAHQIFGEEETIFGYKDLSIDLYYLHNSSKCFLDIKYSTKIDKYDADDVVDLLNPWLPTGYVSSKHEFDKIVENEKHDQMFGSVIHQFERQNEVVAFPGESVLCKYKIVQCDLNDPLFQEYHQRYETLIIWYIDAANFIDLDDHRWLIFYIYEEYKHPKTNETIITPIGFTSIYKFFSYPSSNRARIAQFFILPTHRGKGFGVELYKTVYKNILNMEDVVDITVEEPSKLFQKIRDVCDSCHILEDLKLNNETISTKSPKLLYKYMAKHKICKKQAIRIMDIIQYYNTSKMSERQVENFEDNLLVRIENEFQRGSTVYKMARTLAEAAQESLATTAVIAKAKCSAYIIEIKEVAEKLKNVLD